MLMKEKVLFFVLLLMTFAASAQTTHPPDQIRQRMAEIRRTTNWDYPACKEITR